VGKCAREVFSDSCHSCSLICVIAVGNTLHERAGRQATPTRKSICPIDLQAVGVMRPSMTRSEHFPRATDTAAEARCVRMNRAGFTARQARRRKRKTVPNPCAPHPMTSTPCDVRVPPRRGTVSHHHSRDRARSVRPRRSCRSSGWAFSRHPHPSVKRVFPARPDGGNATSVGSLFGVPGRSRFCSTHVAISKPPLCFRTAPLRVPGLGEGVTNR
jgi:hypothetical protein